MAITTLPEIESLLLRLHLVDQAQLRECTAMLPADADSAALLEALGRRDYLTSLQVQRISKGETEGLVLGGYKLLYRNASGSFARVYRACSVAEGTMIGIKVLRDRWSSDPNTITLFEREGRIGQRLKHKNIVPIYEVAREGRFHYITMEFVEGGNLRDFVKIRGKLTPAEACRYALDMAEALAYALSLGVTHRDLKMTNVLMSSEGVAKLIDFGLAAEEQVLSHVGEGILAQALEYSTLEKYTGAPTNDPRSDLYFLGGILYELVSGTPPYPRTRSRDERRDISRYENIPPLASVAPGLPGSVVHLVDRLLQIDPHSRYQTPTQLIGDLRSAIRSLQAGADMSDSTSMAGVSSNEVVTTVMCIEDRKQHQDWLRKYLSRHGFRVLVLSDVERGLARLETNPPDCVVLMGASVGERIGECYQRAVRIGRKMSVACIAVLSESQWDLVEEMQSESPHARILQQPIQLRDLRTTIAETLANRSAQMN